MKTISFIIPCYNEEGRIIKTFEALENMGQLPHGLRLSEVIFVDDGSTDNTFEKIRTFAYQMSQVAGFKVSVVSYKQNRGKGYAIRAGMLESKSDYALFFDVDMSTPLSEIKKFMPYIKKDVHAIIGTRKNGHSTVTKHQPFIREVLGKGFTQTTKIFLQTNVTDFTCGFKAFSKEATQKIFRDAIISGWGYDAEIIFLTEKNNFSLQEVPVTWANDERTKVSLRSAIIKTLWELAQIRWYHTVKPALKFSIPNLQFSIKSKFSILKMFEN